MQILFHFPKVVRSNFRKKYAHINWRNNKSEFQKWKKGETGCPLVDADIKELNEIGYMLKKFDPDRIYIKNGSRN